MTNIGNGQDPRPEVVDAAPLAEGLLDEHMTAVLQQGHLATQPAACLEPNAGEPLSHINGKALLLFMVLFGTL